MAMSVTAMAFAAVGLLPAVWGALLQEGIDVAVILNSLRALQGHTGEIRLSEEETALAGRFQEEHQAVRSVLERIRTVADSLGELDPPEATVQVTHLYQLLAREVVPHEMAEQEQLYPAVERLLGGADPTGPMSRGHAEIAHQVRRLGQLLEEIGPQGPDSEDTAELRRLLYGLYAVLRLHTEQEEESYLSLRDEPAEPTLAPPASLAPT
jgi:iron-sulfur cluster repair protein YtfE (RIC family)